VIGTIAHNALLISVAVIAIGIFATPYAIMKDRRDLLQLTYAAINTNFLLVSIATVAMIVALVTHDFSVSYVAAVGSRSTPLLFTIISLWGALEGSILFWGWVLAMYSAAVVWLHRDR
jgi:cytochrome c-type biogenesis protein CcmF